MGGWTKNRSFELTDIKKGSSQYPGIAMGRDGKCHVCWQEFKNRHDAVYAGYLEDGAVRGKTRLSGEGEALRPVVCAAGDTVWYAWSEWGDGEWKILLRYHKQGSYSPIMTAARGEALFYPFLFEADGRLALLFNEQGKGYSGCVLCWVDEDGISS